MKIIKNAVLVCCALAALAPTGFADTNAKPTPKQANDAHGSNPAVVVVRSAAKGTWAVTKFTAGRVAKPVAKQVLLKAAPSATKFVVKTAAKNLLPLVVKLSVL